MLFNSLEYAIFLPVVFLIYWALNNNLKIQNFFLLTASYIFYGFWDWKFLGVLIFSSLVDFIISIALDRTEPQPKRKLLLLTSVAINLGLLVFFKYYNFFVESFVDTFTLFGMKPDIKTLNIILPIGISFYTFQTMSYTIDVYRRQIKATTDIVSFLTYVSFFPQLVAGPIERAENLLTQIQKKREFNYDQAVEGTRQILWGLFKKAVVADNCGLLVSQLDNNFTEYSSNSLFIGNMLFAIQIYCDFSGYSDIAIGSAKLLNFSLMPNFKYPFFARNFSEVWRRWHISLTTWVRDYVYLPLGGNKRRLLNNVIAFSLIGFWHGANWTFIIGGIIIGVLFNTMFLFTPSYKKNKPKKKKVVAEFKMLPGFKELRQMLITFFVFSFPIFLFRAENVFFAYSYLQAMFSFSVFSWPEILSKKIILFIGVLILFEWFNRDKEHPLAEGKNDIILAAKCSFIFFMVFFFGVFMKDDFIYFQF